MMEPIKVSVVLPVTPEVLYRAWLSSEEHSAFTGSGAVIDPCEGGDFTAWDGYIRGETLKLEPHVRIVQSWRTTEFPAGSKDSSLEVLFEKVKKGTRMTLVHTGMPDGQGEEYRQGWEDYYIAPMKEYFKGKKYRKR